METKDAERIIGVLDGRAGFDGWWFEILPSIRIEIMEDLQKTIDNIKTEIL